MKIPQRVMWVAQQCLAEPTDDGWGPTSIDILFAALGKPVPNEDALVYAKEELERVGRAGSELAYEVVERLLAGSSHYDTEITEALEQEGLNIEMVDGRFWPRDEVAEELDVVEVAAGVTSRMRGRWAPAKAQWEASQTALAKRRWAAAVADAANALEGVVKIASGKKSINDGTKSLFTAERSSLGMAINQVHNYASAMPGARHGASRASTLTEAEARGVQQAAGVSSP